MRVPLQKLLEALGVKRALSAYETQPWFHYDEDKGITCSAEVRMGPGASDCEAELQFLYDDPEDNPDKAAAQEDRPQQILYMRSEPGVGDSWAPMALRIKGTDYVNKIPKWEEKGCKFFKACIQAIQMGDLPDIDEIEKTEMVDESTGGGRGRIGRKSPKINPASLLGMKK